jgi:hypothetical protein
MGKSGALHKAIVHILILGASCIGYPAYAQQPVLPANFHTDQFAAGPKHCSLSEAYGRDSTYFFQHLKSVLILHMGQGGLEPGLAPASSGVESGIAQIFG